MNDDAAYNLAGEIEKITDETISFFSSNGGRISGRYKKHVTALLNCLEIDLRLRFMERNCHFTRDAVLDTMGKRRVQIESIEGLNHVTTTNSPVSDLDAAFDVGEFCVKNIGKMDRLTAHVKATESVLDFYWTREALGHAMGILCDMVSELSRHYSQVTFNSCLDRINRQNRL